MSQGHRDQLEDVPTAKTWDNFNIKLIKDSNEL